MNSTNTFSDSPTTCIDIVEKLVNAFSILEESNIHSSKRQNYYYCDRPSCLRRKKWGDFDKYTQYVFGDSIESDGKTNTVSIPPILSNNKKDDAVEAKKPNVLTEKILAMLGSLAIESDDYYLYCVNVESSSSAADHNNTFDEHRICSPEKSPHAFGLLLPNEIPPLPSFPIFTKSGEMLVTITFLYDHVRLEKEKWDLLLKFHEYIFEKFLNVVEFPMIFSPNAAIASIIVVPLDKNQKAEDSYRIDWRMLEKVREFEDESLSKNERPNFFEFLESRYQDAIVMPTCIKQKTPLYCHVVRVRTDLNPTSSFSGENFDTYQKYYFDVYKKEISNLSQPLLESYYVHENLNAITRHDENRRGIAMVSTKANAKKSSMERNKMMTTFQVPELCRIHPFPPSLWKQTFYLPSICYRLKGLLIADELREFIAKGINDNNMSHQQNILKERLPRDYTWGALKFERATESLSKQKRSAIQNPSVMEAQNTTTGKYWYVLFINI